MPFRFGGLPRLSPREEESVLNLLPCWWQELARSGKECRLDCGVRALQRGTTDGSAEGKMTLGGFVHAGSEYAHALPHVAEACAAICLTMSWSRLKSPVLVK